MSMSSNIKLYSVLLTVTVAILLPNKINANYSAAQIAKNFSSSVVTIISLDENDQPLGLGSAFIYNKDCDIVTNFHVLENSKKAIIKTQEGAKYKIVEVLKYDVQLDLLIAKTDITKFNPLDIGDSDSVIVGENIVAVGNPAGLAGTISKGIISGIRKFEGIKFIQITSPISPGSSGGPVFNKNGKVIGVATSYIMEGQNLNFAMPVNYLKKLPLKKTKLGNLSKLSNKNMHFNYNNSIVKSINIKMNYISSLNLLEDVYFSIKNSSNYPIKQISTFIVYKNSQGEIIDYSFKRINETILPKLAKQFLEKKDVYYAREVELRILDYEVIRTRNVSPVDVLFDH